MKRKEMMESLAAALNSEKIGCHVRPVGGVLHIQCHAFDSSGVAASPVFWLSYSSSGRWFIQTYNDNCFILPHQPTQDDIIALFALFDSCYNISYNSLIKYNIVKGTAAESKNEDEDMLDLLE